MRLHSVSNNITVCDLPPELKPNNTYFAEGVQYAEENETVTAMNNPAYGENDLDSQSPDVTDLNGLLRMKSDEGRAGPRALQVESRYSVGPMFLDSDGGPGVDYDTMYSANTFKVPKT